MKYEDAITICNNLLVGSGQLGKHFKKWVVCGSLRRMKGEVHDIDMVIIPRDESSYQFGETSFSDRINLIAEDKDEKFLNGDKIKRFKFQGESIDLYIADEKTFETLVLIRTGSKEHNIRLTTIAKQRGNKLFADGRGYCKIDSDGNPIEVIEGTEKGIIENLLGRYVEPKDRD